MTWPRGVAPHKVIRRVDGEVIEVGIPRTRPAVAAVRAAHWAVSNRQAALILLDDGAAGTGLPGAAAAGNEAASGQTSQGFVKESCVTSRSVCSRWASSTSPGCAASAGSRSRTGRSSSRTDRGRVYLDVRWGNGLVVEIDGVQHGRALAVSADNLRTNALVLKGDRALRIDLVGLRVFTDEFMSQVAQGHAQLGAPRR